MICIPLPFLFKNEAHLVVLHSSAADLAKQISKGIKIIAYMDSGARNLFTQKAVNYSQRLEGSGRSGDGLAVMVETMKSLARPAWPVAWQELPALQPVWWMEPKNNQSLGRCQKIYEVSGNSTRLTNTWRIPDSSPCRLKLYDNSTKIRKKAVSRPGRALRPTSWLHGKSRNWKDLQELKAKFTQIIHSGQAPLSRRCRNWSRKRPTPRVEKDGRLHPRIFQKNF